jgi:hypothetical protein
MCTYIVWTRQKRKTSIHYVIIRRSLSQTPIRHARVGWLTQFVWWYEWYESINQSNWQKWHTPVSVVDQNQRLESNSVSFIINMLSNGDTSVEQVGSPSQSRSISMKSLDEVRTCVELSTNDKTRLASRWTHEFSNYRDGVPAAS